MRSMESGMNWCVVVLGRKKSKTNGKRVSKVEMEEIKMRRHVNVGREKNA